MAIRRGRELGASTIEFTLIGIPMIFLLISTFEVARGMWSYETLAYGVKEGTRYASVHGQTCATAPNTCTVTVGQVVQKVLDNSSGLLSSDMNLTLTSLSGATACRPASSCVGNGTVWPPAPDNALGKNIEIDATYPFQSAISMFWPGAGSGMQAAVVTFQASSQEAMQN